MRSYHAFIGFIGLFGTVAPSSAQEETTLYTNAKIVTVDASFSIADSMIVKGSRIHWVGQASNSPIPLTSETKRVDLQGKMVLPGLIDSHVHALGASTFEWDHPVPDMETIQDVLKYIEQRSQSVPKGEWIFVSQVFITRLQEQRFPTREELDQVAPHHPVCFRTGPDAAFNSLGLAKNQIDKNYVAPHDLKVKVERDPSTHEPTGIIRNYAKITKVDASSRSPSVEESALALEKLLRDYNAVGITSIAERSVTEQGLRVFETVQKHGHLTCRVFLNWSVEPNAPWDRVVEQVQTAASHPRHAYDEWLWLRGVKIFLDGGMLTGSAFMRQPWGKSTIYAIDDPNYRGLLYVEPERLYQLAKLCLEKDLQFTAHSVGDGAVHALLQAYDAIDKDFPVRPTRPCITHCNFMSREAIETMKRLGVVADLQPDWLWLDGKTLLQQFGEERLAYFQPYRSIIDSGVIVGGGSDHMQKVGSLRSINPYNPFLGMWIASTRQPRGMNRPLHAEQRIDRREAIKLYTIKNAFLLFDEKNRGSLEPGKLADFIVIDCDLLECPEAQIRSIQVEQTFVGGHQVHKVPSTYR